jgi:hypothetical protein
LRGSCTVLRAARAEMPWPTHQLYKISKQIIEIEDFHSKTERGVKQELYAHLLLINITRIFESKARSNLPAPQNNKISEKIEQKDSYWQMFSNTAEEIKINFKHCVFMVGKYIENLFFYIPSITEWFPKLILSISLISQRIRPGRHYCRQSHKPVKKWSQSVSRKRRSSNDKSKVTTIGEN